MNPFLDKIKDAVAILVKQFNGFRRMPDSPSSHICSCLFLHIKKRSFCLKVEESP